MSLTVLAERHVSMQALEAAIRGTEGSFTEVRVEPSEEADCYVLTVVLDPMSRGKAVEMMDRLKGLPGVRRVELVA